MRETEREREREEGREGWRGVIYSVFFASISLGSVVVAFISARVHYFRQDRAEKKKKLKPFGRTLGKILHAVPLPVFDTIVGQIESFGCNSIGEPLLDSLRYLTPMAFDVMTFVILDRLTMQPLKRRKIKGDGINLSDWLLNLAQLAGESCKRFPGIDMTALCQVSCKAFCLSSTPLFRQRLCVAPAATWVDEKREQLRWTRQRAKGTTAPAVVAMDAFSLMPLLLCRSAAALQYVTNQLKQQEGADLQVLREIIAQVTVSRDFSSNGGSVSHEFAGLNPFICIRVVRCL
jgi:hypothetical protein